MYSLYNELSDLKIDINPKRWISKFHNTSIVHLFLMLMFYHAIGVLLLLFGSTIIQYSLSGYVGPSIPRYLAPVIAAGPIEESIFFGIPYYAIGNQFAVIISGITWVMLHLFNAKTTGAASLSYYNWLFVIPSFFYSLRTWITGKGWFAIIAHSIWNAIFFTLGCVYNEYSCSIFPPAGTSSLYQFISIATVAALVISLTFIFYERRRRIRAEARKKR